MFRKKEKEPEKTKPERKARFIKMKDRNGVIYKVPAKSVSDAKKKGLKEA